MPGIQVVFRWHQTSDNFPCGLEIPGSGLYLLRWKNQQRRWGNSPLDEKYFSIEKGDNFFCYMKYNFSKKKIFSANTLIKHAIKENRNCNINIVAGKNKIIQPTIKIKINNYESEAELYTPKKLYKLIQSTFNDFFNENFDYKKLRIKTVRDVIINLIQFGEELNQNEKILPVSFLIYTLYFFKDI